MTVKYLSVNCGSGESITFVADSVERPLLDVTFLFLDCCYNSALLLACRMHVPLFHVHKFPRHDSDFAHGIFLVWMRMILCMCFVRAAVCFVAYIPPMISGCDTKVAFDTFLIVRGCCFTVPFTCFLVFDVFCLY